MMTETVGLAGAEMVVFQLTQELRARGHTLEAVVPKTHEGWLIEALTADGFKVHRWDLRRAIDRTLPRRLAGQLRDAGIDLAHSHEFTASVYGAAATKILGIPQVITMHANQGTADRFRRRVALRWAFRNSYATVAVSDDTRVDMEKRLGVRSGLIKVIPNGIPEIRGDREKTRAGLGVASDEALILSVGTLTPRKAHSKLIEAMVMITQRGSDAGRPWRVAIAGDGAERSNLESMIRENGLEDRVMLLGRRTDIPDLQAAADLFVLPSLWEGLPLAILEAMFAGNAIVASNVSGIPEAVKHGEHGLLTPPGDAEQLADAIGQLLRDPARRTAMGGGGLERARREFGIAAMTDAYEDLYYAAIAHVRKRSPLVAAL